MFEKAGELQREDSWRLQRSSKRCGTTRPALKPVSHPHYPNRPIMRLFYQNYHACIFVLFAVLRGLDRSLWIELLVSSLVPVRFFDGSFS